MSKFIPIDKMKTLREKAATGDERAKGVLGAFSSGGDFLSLLEEYFTEPEEVPEVLEKMEEAGEEATDNALAADAVVENDVEESHTLNEIIESLIADENEAIEGYDKAILYVANTETDRNALSVLEEIKNDEIRHIKMLKELISCEVE